MTPRPPSDPFEETLRSLLQERAEGPVPPRLASAAERAVAAHTSGAAGSSTPGRLRRLGSSMAALSAAAVFLILAVTIGPSLLIPPGARVTPPPTSDPRSAVSTDDVSPEPTPGPSASPFVAASRVPDPLASSSPGPPDLAPAIVWDSGEVRLTASAIRIQAGDQVFTGQVPVVEVGGDPGSATYRTLEVTWHEHDREQRLSIYLAADRTSWWVTEIRTYNGAVQGDWVTYPGLQWRAPIGATWSGVLRATDGPYALEIDGMTLRAFDPRTIPAQLRFCRPAIDPGTGDGVEPLAVGQPLAGTGIEDMSPVQAQAVLRALGLCHMFNYGYQYTDDPGSGYGERWCDPPPGVIASLFYGSDGEVIVMVRDAVPTQHSPRPQPPVGWGC